MMIIAFSTKTSKILPRIFCGRLKHVAPIVIDDDKIVLYQFVQMGKIVQIPIQARDINILAAHGWQFVYLTRTSPQSIDGKRIYTCVHLAKTMIGIKCARIQTPNRLYKEIARWY